VAEVRAQRGNRLDTATADILAAALADMLERTAE
jgi:hypothetical protein